VKHTLARELFVCDGQLSVGKIKVAKDGTAIAFDPNGKRLGKFPNFKSACTAFNKPVKRGAQL